MQFRDLPERIQNKIAIEPNSGCWLWTGALIGEYGTLTFNYEQRFVHRFCYERLIGPIPPGLELDHLCRIRSCCNPAHLEPVTRKMNINRGRRFNGEKTHCKRGHPFDEQNTYLNPSDGHRQCRACAKEMMAIYYRKHKSTNI